MSTARKAERPPESAEILRARRLLAPDVSFEQAWAELNDASNHATPQVTVMFSVRERGLAALRQPDKLERLARCDVKAKAQINKRIRKFMPAEAAARV